MNWTWAQTGALVSLMGFLACATFLYFVLQEARDAPWSADDSANFIRLVQLAFFLFLALCYFGDVGNIVPFQGAS